MATQPQEPIERPLRIIQVQAADLLQDDDEEMYVLWYTPASDPKTERPQGADLHLNRVRVARLDLRGLPKEVNELPSRYADFANVANGPGDEGFPPDTKAEHAIDLQPGTTAPYGPIYPMSGKELDALRQYLDDALAKG